MKTNKCRFSILTIVVTRLLAIKLAIVLDITLAFVLAIKLYEI